MQALRNGSFRWLGLASGSFLLACLVFWLPYHVPLAPSLSDSYMVGFNNRAATVVTLLGTILIGAFLPQAAVRERAGKPLQRSTAVKAVLITLLLSVAVAVYIRRVDGFGESVYTVDRVKDMLEGRVPYRDFEYAYGALLLYGPYSLARWFSLPVPDACGAFGTLLNVVGVLQLYQMLRWAETPRAKQRAVFLLLFVSTVLLTLSTGSGYSLPRYLTPLFCAMALQQTLRRAASPARRASLLFLLLPSAALVSLLSPEMGLAFSAAMFLYCLRYFHLREPRELAAVATVALPLAGLVFAADRLGVFLTLRAFSSGGYNFPLVPALHLLLFFVALALTAGYVVSSLRARKDTALLASSLVALAIVPAALGRCDLAHVSLDGFGVFLCALLVSGFEGWKRHLLPAAFFVIFLAMPLALGIRDLLSPFVDLKVALLLHDGTPRDVAWAKLLSLRVHGTVKGTERLVKMRTLQTATDTVDIAHAFHVPQSTIFAAPFLFEAGHLGPYHSRQVEEGYFLGTINVVSPQAVARKTAELADHPERPLLVPAGAASSCIRSPEDVQSELRSVLLYPYRVRVVHPGSILEPFCEYIRDHYRQQQAATPSHFGYEVWVRGEN